MLTSDPKSALREEEKLENFLLIAFYSGNLGRKVFDLDTPLEGVFKVNDGDAVVEVVALRSSED